MKSMDGAVLYTSLELTDKAVVRVMQMTAVQVPSSSTRSKWIAFVPKVCRMQGDLDEGVDRFKGKAKRRQTSRRIRRRCI